MREIKEVITDPDILEAVIQVLRWQSHDAMMGPGKSSLRDKAEKLSDIIYKKTGFETEVLC